LTIPGGFLFSLLQPAPTSRSSLLELLLRASPIAKVVLVILLLFSIYSWAIIITKWLWLRRAEQSSKRFLTRFRGGAKLSEMYGEAEGEESPIGRVFLAGYGEFTGQLDESTGQMRSLDALSRVLQSETIAQVNRMERSLSWLATTANASPFIGLFGTVVGIIIAFQGLSAASASSIQAVAPGIAEALIATAAGIGAAVPAAIFYNQFLNRVKMLTATLDRFSLELLNLVERHYAKAKL
jgi:biopolymer transport protein TolQ